MKSRKSVLLAALLAACVAPAWASVLVYDVKVDDSGPGVAIQYRLFDAADAAVSIEVYGPLPDTTVLGTIPGSSNEGFNSVNWSGSVGAVPTDENETYGFRILAEKATGYAEWTEINDVNNSRFQFEQPRGGVAINTDMESPLFGMIYVGNTRDLPTATGRTMAAGVYAFFPDTSDPLGFADTPATGGVDWTLSGTASPWKLHFGVDGKLWIPDWSDAHAGIWRAEQDLGSPFTEILDNTGRTSAGLVAGIHGSVACVWTAMDGDDVVLYWQDEDLATGTGPADGLRSIWKQTITDATTFPITANSVVAIDENDFQTNVNFDATIGIMVNDAGGGLVQDADGNFWVSNYRAGGNDFPGLMQITPDGSTLLWDSLTGSSGTTNMGADVFSYVLGTIAVDADANVLYVSRNADFVVFPLSSPLPDTLQDLEAAVTVVEVGGQLRGLDIDPAGNVYAISNISEALHIFSPPGPTSFTFENSTLELPGGDLGPLQAENWMNYR